MPLHRDIFWVGRQWAVTGHGMQLIDQKLKGYFDIEIARVWDDDLADELLAKTWINAADFNRGLEVARARYPEPSHGAAASDPGALGSPERAPVDPDPEPPKLERPSRGEPPPLAALPLHETVPIRPPEPEPAAPKPPVRDVVREHRILSLLESVLSETPKPQSPKVAELPVQAVPPQQLALNAQYTDPIEPSESEPPKFVPATRPEESVFRFGDSAPVEPPKPVPLAPESPKLLRPREASPPEPNFLRVQGAVAIRPAASEPVKPAAHDFSMHVPRWPAKFVAIWRVRVY